MKILKNGIICLVMFHAWANDTSVAVESNKIIALDRTGFAATDVVLSNGISDPTHVWVSESTEKIMATIKDQCK